MNVMNQSPRLLLVLASLLLTPLTAFAEGKVAPLPGMGTPAPAPSAADLKVSVVPFGPTQADMDQLAEKLPELRTVRAVLGKGVNFRHLYTDLIEADLKAPGTPLPPTRFRAVFYDYSNQRAVVAEGLVADAAASTTAKIQPDWQPEVSQEEFNEAIAVLLSDKTVGPALISGELTTYYPMPPVQERDDAGNAARTRIIHVGLSPRVGSDRLRNEIVGINLAAQSLERYPRNAPLGAVALSSPNCGVSSAGQASTSRGTAGQYQLTVSDASGVIWDMLVIRPSASSGTRASGIEVRNVNYRGRSVLKRGHVPILNVKYNGDTCGPYRDWQYQEGQFATTGTDVAPGIRDCGTNVATTALENGTDTGNFRGVAIYRQGSDVVLVTELEAGWYRYVHEWRFDTNGTIRPRFGFGATSNSCTCLTHYHHVYFRLDVDIDGPINNVFEIPSGPRLAVAKTSRPVSTEKKFARTAEFPEQFRIRGDNRSYLLIPGKNDGIADAYGRGDMWVLKYKSGATNLLAEIDDGNNNTGGSTEANLDQFVNGESILDQDIVIWYHATVNHSPTVNSFMCTPTGLGIPGRNILTGDKVVGPDLVLEDN